MRPIAFRPVHPHNKYDTSTPRPYSRKCYSHDDGYGSQDYQAANHSSANTSNGYLHGDSDRSASFSSDCNKLSDRPESLASSNISRVSSNHMEGYAQTPSPSDSGVYELEAMLKEKEIEINTMRHVMDKNERAIFQVHEVKKHSWMMEMREMKEEFERKLKIHQRRSNKSEQMLSLQIDKLKQEKRTLKEAYDQVYQDKDLISKRFEACNIELQQVKSQVDESKWQTHQKVGEMALVKQQLKDSQEALAIKTNEVLNTRSQLKCSQSELEQKSTQLAEKCKELIGKTEEVKFLKLENNNNRSELKRLESCDSAMQTESRRLSSPMEISTDNIDNVKSELLDVKILKQQLAQHEENFEIEKNQWIEEKNKVIRYQKQLQLNYVQMFRKNRTLEAEVEQLTLELESRDMKLLALNGEEESIC